MALRWQTEERTRPGSRGGCPFAYGPPPALGRGEDPRIFPPLTTASEDGGGRRNDPSFAQDPPSQQQPRGSTSQHFSRRWTRYSFDAFDWEKKPPRRATLQVGSLPRTSRIPDIQAQADCGAYQYAVAPTAVVCPSIRTGRSPSSSYGLQIKSGATRAHPVRSLEGFVSDPKGIATCEDSSFIEQNRPGREHKKQTARTGCWYKNPRLDGSKPFNHNTVPIQHLQSPASFREKCGLVVLRQDPGRVAPSLLQGNQCAEVIASLLGREALESRLRLRFCDP